MIIFRQKTRKHIIRSAIIEHNEAHGLIIIGGSVPITATQDTLDIGFPAIDELKAIDIDHIEEMARNEQWDGDLMG